MEEANNILRILKETKSAIRLQDSVKLKELSNQTINTASRTQDIDDIAVAVIVYSLGKIIERENYRRLPGWDKLYSTIIFSIDESIKDVAKNDKEKFRKDFEEIRRAIGKLSGRLRKYIKDVFRKASINKASRIYEHGISMEKTAKLLGITMYELADYAGQTGISNVPLGKTFDVKERVKLAMTMFN